MAYLNKFLSMKILYITSLYDLKNSSAAIRNNSLVKGLLELGHIVDVWTVRWPSDLQSDFFIKESNYSTITRFELSDISLNDSFKKSVRISNPFINTIKKNIKKILFFPDVCRSWKNVKVDENELLKYDLLISSSDMKSSHFLADKIKDINEQLPWVQIWGDPWSTDVNTPFYLKCISKYFEKRILRRGDLVFYVSLPTTKEMKILFPEFSDKINYVPRGYYSSVANPAERISKDYHIVYTGALNEKRNIFNLAIVLDKYNKSHDKKILIDVYGTFSDDLKTEMLKFESLQLHKDVDYEKIPEIYSNSDALLYLSNGSSTTQIPGKLYDYFGTQKSVICLVYDQNDEISKFLKTFSRCLLLENSISAIEDNLKTLELSLNSVWDIDDAFSPISIARQMIFLVEKIADSSKGSICIKSKDEL